MEDEERPLNPEGIGQGKAAGRGVKQLGLSFDLVITSPKRRARQTAALVAEAVRFPYSDIMSSDAVMPQSGAQNLLKLIRQEPAESSILIVGHLPQLEELSKELLKGCAIAFSNAGLICIEISETGAARLMFMLTNQQLAQLG